jgi:hypothetical protein
MACCRGLKHRQYLRKTIAPQNAPDQLPGRLHRLEVTDNQNAGTVSWQRLVRTRTG